MALARFNARLHHVLGRLGRADMRVGSARPGGEAGLERDEKEPKITGLEGPADPDVVQPRPGELELHWDSALPGSRGQPA